MQCEMSWDQGVSGRHHRVGRELRVWGAEVSACREGRWELCPGLRSAHHKGGQGSRLLWHVNPPKGGLGFGQLGRIEKRPRAEEL